MALLHADAQSARADFGRNDYLSLVIPVLACLIVLDRRIARSGAVPRLTIFVVWLVWFARNALRR